MKHTNQRHKSSDLKENIRILEDKLKKQEQVKIRTLSHQDKLEKTLNLIIKQQTEHDQTMINTLKVIALGDKTEEVNFIESLKRSPNTNTNVLSTCDRPHHDCRQDNNPEPEDDEEDEEDDDEDQEMETGEDDKNINFFNYPKKRPHTQMTSKYTRTPSINEYSCLEK